MIQPWLLQIRVLLSLNIKSLEGLFWVLFLQLLLLLGLITDYKVDEILGVLPISAQLSFG